METKRWRNRRLVLALPLVVLALWTTRKVVAAGEPPWRIELRAERSDLLPWAKTEVTAAIEPAPEVSAGWRWSWRTDLGALDETSPSLTWGSGRSGAHRITVSVTSPWGTTKTESVVLRVSRDVKVVSAHAAAEPPADARPGLPFEIEDIAIEKTQVCRGEPSRIRVTARHKEGKLGRLHPVIDGQSGWEVPFLRLAGAPGYHEVSILVNDPHHASDDAFIAERVYIELKDCVARFPTWVEASPLPNAPDRFQLEAKMVPGDAWHRTITRTPTAEEVARGQAPTPEPVARAARYRWSFGDGTEAVSTDPVVRHTYPSEEERPTGEDVTRYLVRVDALDAAGEVLGTGYATVALSNPHDELKHTSGVVQLLTRYHPHPRRGEDGELSIDVTLRNLDAVETAHLSDIELQFTSCDGELMEERRTLGASEVFESVQVAPRSTVTGRFRQRRDWVAGACHVRATIAGRTVTGGLAVTGYFSMALGPSKAAARVSNAGVVARLARARELLGNPAVITPADLQRLEDTGALPPGTVAELTGPRRE